MSDFNVMDMIDDYAAESGIDAKDIFKKKDPVKSPDPLDETIDPIPANDEESKTKEWTPDASLMDELDDFKPTSVVYAKEDFIMEEQPLKDLGDEAVKEEAAGSMGEMDRKLANIEEAKKRHGIVKLQIPPGELQVKFLLAAGSTNHEEAQDYLDQLIAEVEKTYPEAILERVPGSKPVDPLPVIHQPEPQPQPQPEPVPEAPKNDSIEGVDTPPEPLPSTNPSLQTGEDVKVVIDKNNVSELTWTAEEAAKIRKSRTLELNIVEGKNLEFGSIEDIPSNAVDAILSTYERKTNDIAAVLPASKYRAVFSGLTYPEVIDLSSANQINNLDGERLKWTIVFNHIRNMSIGPWEEYILYKDEKGKEIRVNAPEEIPSDIPSDNIHPVSKYEDFMRKTSYMDLEFCLWKILCATAMEKEVITIDCHTDIGNGHECGNTYDWIYAPEELLVVDSIPKNTLDEMKEAADANSIEDAIRVYKTSQLNSNNFVELHSSGYRIIFGHISAYEYVEHLYSKMKELEDATDPAAISKGLTYTMLTTTKAALVPNGKGGYGRIAGIDDLEKVLSKFDEIDYETISQINTLVTKPYQFEFSMRGIVCPKCKNRSMIPITDMSRLLFIVARSLSSVNITLRHD